MISDDKNRITLDLILPGKDEFLQTNSMVAEIKGKVSSNWKQYRGKGIHPKRVLTYLILSQFYSLFNIVSDTSQHGKFRSDFIPRGMSVNVKTHYLPAVRGGLMQSHRILVRAVISRAPTIGLTGAAIIPFTGVLADFLEKLLMINDARSKFRSRRINNLRTKDMSNLTKKIEQQILHGEIAMETSETDYPDFRYQFIDQNAESQDISLMHASSSVSELAPIVLFIRLLSFSQAIFLLWKNQKHTCIPVHNELSQVCWLNLLMPVYA